MQETFIGHRFKFINSEKIGITLELNSLSNDNKAKKYSISYDNESKIDTVNQDQIILGEKISKIDFFLRLVRDIQSNDDQTREYASSTLCDFLEFDTQDFNLEVLENGIDIIIEQIKIEKNINVEQKLVEGIFEFIWLKRITKIKEIGLLERLTEIDKYYIWSYLGDEITEDVDGYNSEKLNDYYSKNIEKWKEKDILMYGEEKMNEYTNKPLCN
ncbi:hypothetical protein [Emticicia oligotrophica]|uniref:hypothetical protein n=1 Tax=Emticicia oligotrophica TaxID=312279 RepID=UPI00273A984E|nr:hypothetical protein [Emticicia oligotrophica]